MNRIVARAPIEAGIKPACDLLTAHGIAFRVRGAALTGLQGWIPVDAAEVLVEVLNEDDVDRARKLLAEAALAADHAMGWACEQCQEENPGTFDVCWKCGRGQPAAAARPSHASPYRGDRPIDGPPAEAPAPTEAAPLTTRQLSVGLTVAVVVGLSGWLLRQRFDFPAGWSAGARLAAVQAVMALELSACLLWFVRRGAPLRAAWGGTGRAHDVVTGLLCGGLLYIVKEGTGGVADAIMNAFADQFEEPIKAAAASTSGLEWVWRSAGALGFSTAASLLGLGVLFPELRVRLRSRLAAAALMGGVGALLWTAGMVAASPAMAAVQQALLCAAYLVTGRIRPLVVGVAFSELLAWHLAGTTMF